MLTTHKVSVRIGSGKQSMDVIPSDDECFALSDVSNGPAYRENAKFYDRVHHHHSSSSSRRRKHYREHHERRYSEEERDTACRTHVRRRGSDLVRPKRRRMKPVLTSSDDDCFEVTSREELKAALNINDGFLGDASINRSTLLHKLKAIHNKSSVKSDQEDTAKKKATAKKRRRNKARSRGVSVHVPVPVGDDIGFDEQAIDAAIVDALFIDGNHVTIGDDDCVDEAVSLEEQELRLIALKSAVMKKHEARKKRQFVLSIRAYSPTDSLVAPLDEEGTCGGEGDADEMVNQLEVIDDTEDNNNMDISPASSPESNTACQPMDMDLVSSNDDNSQGPVVFASSPKDVFHPHTSNEHDLSWMYGMPLVRNQNFNNFPITANETFYNGGNLALTAQVMGQIQPPLDTEMVNRITSMASEEENSLRARLIADLNCSESKRRTANAISPTVATSILGATEDGNQDESLEADCLRSLLLSSIKHKKSRSPAIANTIEESTKNEKQPESSRSMMDMPNLPKITSNLKEAVKRLQNKNKTITHSELPAQATNVNASNPEITLNLAEAPKADSAPAESMQTSNSNTPSTKPSSPIATVAMPQNDANCSKPSVKSMEAPASLPSAGKKSTNLPQRVIARAAQTLSKLIATKEIVSTPAKPITPVTKVIKILKSSSASATAET